MQITLINNLNSDSITVNEKLLSLIEVDNFAKKIRIAQNSTSFTTLIVASEINIQKSQIEKITVSP